jgi:hypothetical protein
MKFKILLILALLMSGPVFAGPEMAQAQPPVASGAPPNTDPHGSPISFDPSLNVKELTDAATKRQDDLRTLETKRQDDLRIAEDKLSALRFEHMQETIAASSLKLSDEAKLRAEFADRLNVAEAKRIDAIRAVDVGAVAINSQRTAEATAALATQTSSSAEVLRNQVATSAEALRALVASTAAAAQIAQQQLVTGLTSRIDSLSARLTIIDQNNAEGKGKQTIQDPAISSAIAELTKNVQILSQHQADQAGIGQGRGDVVGWAVAGITLLIAFAGLFFMAMRRPQVPRNLSLYDNTSNGNGNK